MAIRARWQNASAARTLQNLENRGPQPPWAACSRSIIFRNLPAGEERTIITSARGAWLRIHSRQERIDSCARVRATAGSRCTPTASRWNAHGRPTAREYASISATCIRLATHWERQRCPARAHGRVPASKSAAGEPPLEAHCVCGKPFCHGQQYTQTLAC